MDINDGRFKTESESGVFQISINQESDWSVDGGYTFEHVTNTYDMDILEASILAGELLDFSSSDKKMIAIKINKSTHGCCSDCTTFNGVWIYCPIYSAILGDDFDETGEKDGCEFYSHMSQSARRPNKSLNDRLENPPTSKPESEETFESVMIDVSQTPF